MLDLNPVEIRVLGCLIEKQRTTPDTYPLTLNALRLACNQSTNRDPVVDYDEHTIRVALERLARRRYVRLASGHTTRATKYRHLLDDTLSLSVPELAVLAVLMLRGPQTPGELRQRTERLHRFPDQDSLEAVLRTLSERDYTIRLDRRPGQKEQRFKLLLDDDDSSAEPPEPEAPVTSHQSPVSSTDARIERLERDVAQLQAELADLRNQLGA
ncbi:MAG TPA: YceH family protein [Thermoleophilaceae bacterium]